MPVTGGSACRSTSGPILAPSARAYRSSHDPVSEVAPLNSASRSAVHSRRCTPPPRVYRPGWTPLRSNRAPPAAIASRPGGLKKSSAPPTTSHQGAVGSHE
jgi:hypothetical protein